MKKIHALLFVTCFAFAACGGGGGTPPNQADVDAAVNDFTSTGVEIANKLDITDCASFNASLAQFNGQPINCDSGTIILSVVDSDCSDGPPFTASVTVALSADQCEDSGFGTSTNGGINYEITAAGVSGAIQASTSGVTVNGITFKFNDLGIQLPDNADPTCGGNVKANDAECGVTNDCTACNF